ncbi:membrane protein insertase, YidC/Oxa1 family protein [Nitzschia inconspicua]|uniref:Membrane protein insertase, YidC/Oxa1 family protein n=1 Tax=Nitzschia inconspicua TaxID=303405 RepID=A0A9K3Q3H7_9STRA|nr:membrane protein insertase, YidC/Oxa1 family protein [Nitzschia inconspicua]
MILLLSASSLVQNTNAFQTGGRNIAFKHTTQQQYRQFKQHQQSHSSLQTDLKIMIDPNDATMMTHISNGISNPPETSSLDVIILQTQWLLSDAAAAAAASKSDNGWWSAYLNIFKTALTFVHNTIDGPLRSVGVTQTWGPSIALFTAGVRSLLIPLSLQQSKSSEYLKALKPYMAEIKEKFKDSPDAQNRAIGKLYEDANQNPLSGCLVSLAQIPIFLGLYRGVRLLALDGQLDEPFLWIPSLEGPVTAASDYRGMDWLTQGWQTIDGTLTPSLGWETTLAFCIMPVILVLGQSLTMSVLSPPVDENASDEEREQMEKTQGILKFLPLMIGFFSLQVPAGLTIYWFTSNIFSLTQSLAVRKYYELYPPKIELPDYWDSLDNLEAMSGEEKKKAAAAGIAVGPKFEDLVTNSKFHTIVERKPLRLESPAWKRLVEQEEQTSGRKVEIPMEFQSWVAATESTNGENHGVAASTTTTTAQQEAAAVSQP